METLLSMLFVLSVPSAFGLAIAYFFALSRFRNRIAAELPNVWNKERAAARPLETWVPTAYRLLQRFKDRTIDGQSVSAELLAAHRRAKALLYLAACVLMVLLFSGLLFDAVRS